jgi:hypothetical protein
MRVATASLLALLVSSLTLSGCGGGEKGYSTLQACYDEHHVVENLPVLQAIVVCCLDHPIVGVAPSCRDTQADCVAHVDAELDGSVTTTDIQAACTEYITQKG